MALTLFGVFLSLLLVVLAVHGQSEEEFARSALLEAVAEHNADAFFEALLAGEDIDTSNDQEWTAARIAVETNDISMLQAVVDAGADLNIADLAGITPLMAAALAADREMTELLLLNNASPFVVSNEGLTSFDYASQSGRQFLVFLIAESAALQSLNSGDLDGVLEAVRRGAYINIRNPAGWTPLMLASSTGHFDAVQELISLGAQLHFMENDGWSALHLAAAHGHDAVVELLLQYKADKTMQTADGLLAKDLAVRQGHTIVQDLLDEL